MDLEKLWNDGFIPLIDGLILSNGEIKLFDIAVLTPAVNPVYINLGDFDYAA